MEYLKRNWLLYILGFLILAIVLFEAQGQGDFSIFLSASNDLWAGKNVYTTMYQEWYHYYYGVFFAIVLTPLTFLPLYVAKVIWLLFNVFFVYRIWKIIADWLPFELVKKRTAALIAVISFLFAARFIRDNFHLSQVTIFILYLSLEGIYLIGKDKKIGGALLLAFGIDVKLMPLIMIPYLLYRGEWKAVFFIFGFVLVFLFLPSVFIGHSFNLELLMDRWLLLNPANQAHVLDTSERSFHSLTTLLATLFVENTGDANHILPIKRNIADISIERLNMIINACRGILMLGTFWFLRTLPFKKSKSGYHKLYEISYLCLVTPLIFPHQQHYAFFFAFPAFAYLVFYLIYNYYNKETIVNQKNFMLKKISLTALLSIIFLLSSSHLILGSFNEYYDHFKTLTYGMLLLVGVLAACGPGKVEKVKYKTQ